MTLRQVNDAPTVLAELARAQRATMHVRDAGLFGPYVHADDGRECWVPIIAVSTGVAGAREVFNAQARGGALDVSWRWSTLWHGHAPSDAWVCLRLRYPEVGVEFDLGFNGEFDRRLLRAICDASSIAWTPEPAITPRTFGRAVCTDMNVEGDLGEMLRLIEQRKRHGARERPLRVVRPRSRKRRRSERPRGPR